MSAMMATPVRNRSVIFSGFLSDAQCARTRLDRDTRELKENLGSRLAGETCSKESSLKLEVDSISSFSSSFPTSRSRWEDKEATDGVDLLLLLFIVVSPIISVRGCRATTSPVFQPHPLININLLISNQWFLTGSVHILAPECCMHCQRQFGKHSTQSQGLNSQLSRTESQIFLSHACAVVCAGKFKILEPGFSKCGRSCSCLVSN